MGARSNNNPIFACNDFTSTAGLLGTPLPEPKTIRN
jgi:hypothetical protein